MVTRVDIDTKLAELIAAGEPKDQIPSKLTVWLTELGIPSIATTKIIEDLDSYPNYINL